jgi:hypothetical protein
MFNFEWKRDFTNVTGCSPFPSSSIIQSSEFKISPPAGLSRAYRFPEVIGFFLEEEGPPSGGTAALIFQGVWASRPLLSVQPSTVIKFNR